jgi:RNA recognition motif-containing protein
MDSRKRYLDFPPSHQIYVARFAPRTREIDLKRAFEKYGRVESIDLKDRGCFAFIVSADFYFDSFKVYSDARSAMDAIDDMNGRTLPYESERLIVE